MHTHTHTHTHTHAHTHTHTNTHTHTHIHILKAFPDHDSSCTCTQYTCTYIHGTLISNTDGSDYSSTVLTVTFVPTDDQISQEICIPLPIIDDLIANEADEQFSVVLIDVTPTANVGNNETCVTIIDNDGKYIATHCLVNT